MIITNRRDIWYSKRVRQNDNTILKQIEVHHTRKYNYYIALFKRSLELYQYLVPEDFLFSYKISGSSINVIQNIASPTEMKVEEYFSFAKNTYLSLSKYSKYPIVMDFQPGNNIMKFNDSPLFIDELKIQEFDDVDLWKKFLKIETTRIFFTKFDLSYFQADEFQRNFQQEVEIIFQI